MESTKFSTDKENFVELNADIRIKKALEYSEKPELLKQLLDQVKVFYRYKGELKPNWDKDGLHSTIEVKIERNGRKIFFDFTLSTNDTEAITAKISPFGGRYKGKYYSNSGQLRKVRDEGIAHLNESLLYKILCCCRSDYYIPWAFGEFCDEQGYNNDSISAKCTWETCVEQKSKLQRVFNESEIEYLPS